MGMGAEGALLKKMGLDVAAPDTGCCGMAGSFGFNPDHYELSIKAAEQGFAYAEVSLGVFLTQGEPTDAALVEALMWFERGAYQGISYAMMRTAEAYAFGLGTPA